MSFLNKIKNEKLAALKLIRGYDESNRPVYAFVLGRLSDLDAIQEYSQRLLVNLSEKVLILHHGAGHVVSKTLEESIIAELHNYTKKPA